VKAGQSVPSNLSNLIRVRRWGWLMNFSWIRAIQSLRPLSTRMVTGGGHCAWSPLKEIRAGSDWQIDWLKTFEPGSLPKDVAVVMVHLINPWGTAWLRRVNEDNIDLNRNHLDFTVPLPDNRVYAALHEIYACTDLHGPERQRADALLDAQINEHGWPAVSLLYGGRAPSWSNRTLHQIINEHLTAAETVMCFDLHTGAGDTAIRCC
jgi:hypothetical protein